jgi:hypothetical protein
MKKKRKVLRVHTASVRMEPEIKSLEKYQIFCSEEA